MMRHDFHIVRTCRVKVDHVLLGNHGATLDKVHEVYSHSQAIRQCSEFLDSRHDINVHVVENTALAAQMVAKSGRTDVAALSSRSCADLYGLDVIDKDIQNKQSNVTRFACISKDLEIYPGADRTSLMMVTSNDPGSLYKVLARFYALDINLVKLQSRPIPDRDFEFMFYFDVDCPVAAPELATLVRSLEEECEEFRYLGSYSEVV
jgi:chorismate mutase/prephenate dehydratase